MNCNLPKEWNQLKKREQERIMDVFARQENRDMAVMLRQYMMMVCCVLHDGHGLGEEDLTCFLGSFRQFFRRQQKLVKDGTQPEELERRMKEIFPTSGFPDDFFASFLADWS